MKKYIVILFLLAGLSNLSFSQGGNSKRHERSGTIKKKQATPRKQTFHFSKEQTDKKIASNGTSYRKSKKYILDGNGFKSARSGKKDRKNMADNRAQKKHYHKKLRESVFAKNTDGGSLRKQRMFTR